MSWNSKRMNDKKEELGLEPKKEIIDYSANMTRKFSNNFETKSVNSDYSNNSRGNSSNGGRGRGRGRGDDQGGRGRGDDQGGRGRRDDQGGRGRGDSKEDLFSKKISFPDSDYQGGRGRGDYQGGRGRGDYQGGRGRGDYQGGRGRGDYQGGRGRGDYQGGRGRGDYQGGRGDYQGGRGDRKNYSSDQYLVKMSGVPNDIDADELKEQIYEWGELGNISIKSYTSFNRETNQEVIENTCAFINFKNEDAAKNFVEAHDETVLGHMVINVELKNNFQKR